MTEQTAAEKRTAEVADHFNNLLRGERGGEQDEKTTPTEKTWDRDKAIARLTAEAADGDQEAADALRALQRPAGPRKPPKSADGGEGGERVQTPETAASQFNKMVRQARFGPEPWWTAGLHYLEGRQR